METELPIMNEEIGVDELDNVDLIEDGDDSILDGVDKGSENAQDPYDTFMRRHLQHYGYFTGRNASYRNNYDGLENWHRNYDLRLSGTQNLSADEERLRKMGHFPPHRHATVDSNLGQFFSEGQPPDELLSRTTQLVFQYQSGKKIPKLREPRNLYALTKEPGPQQATRWPSHMQVVCSSIHFIDYNPPVPDPFYVPTGKEPTPAVRGTPNGEIVYLNDPGRDVYFMRSRVAGCRLAMRDISLTPRESVDDGNFTLEFESRFESGNLLKAVKINDFDYELTLRPDLYTNKHTQWYFFRVRNMIPDKNYRITIVNLMKPSSLYNHGMKPLFYSETNAKKNKVGWCRAGTDIRYYRNNLGSMSGRNFYSLTWSIQFPNKGDTCYFAHCYPYTYTDLQEYLLKLANDPVRSRFCKQRVLCRTLAGNLVYVLTVTSPSRNPEIARAKKAVVLTARVHPGETNASWMMKGVLDFLSGNSADAKLLRDNFIFKIVPMLNPDGVIVGNYRCSLAGRDLNRNYKSVLKDSFPSVWHVKMMAKRLNMEREIALYCDLHGHSRKNNIFIYGCENKNNPQRKFRERIFPLMLSKNADTKFQFESCKFKIQKSKEGTGRVVMWCMGIMNSFTMEATFGGTSLGSRKGTHFSNQDLEEMGHNLCDTILDYCDPDPAKVEACYQEIQDRVRKQILKRMQMKNIQGSIGDVNLDDYSSEYESDTSGSDSSCDDGLPVHLLAIAPKLQRKRRLKTRRDRNKLTARKSAPAQEELKPTPSQGPKPIVEKAKPIRYSQTAGNKRRDDSNHVGVGTASHSAGYAEERATKKSDYLEALTTAYIRSGVLMVPDKKEYSMRYTSGMGKTQSNNNVTVQYLAGQLSNLTESGSESETGPLMRNAACQWSPQPDYANFDSDNKPIDEETKEAVLAEEQYEILRKSALRRQLSPAQQRVLAQRHLVAVAQMQQRREQTRTVPSTSVVQRGGTPLKQHPNPFDEKSEISGHSRANSRCNSVTQKKDTRKSSLQSVSRPSSSEANIRTTRERTSISSDNFKMFSSDSTVPTNKKTSAVPPSTETTITNEELINNKSNVHSMINSTIKTIRRIPQASAVTDSNFTSDIFSSKTAPDGIKSAHDDVNIPVVQKQKTDEKAKGQSILVFGSSETTFVNNNMTPNNTEVTENFLPENSIIKTTSQLHNKRGRDEAKNAGKNQDESKKHNPVFGEALGMLPAAGDEPKHRTSPSTQHKRKNKPKSQSSVLSDDLNLTEVSLEKLPMEWGGRKQLVTLDVNSEGSPEPIKRDRMRILSGSKKTPLSNVIAEGHSSRYRSRNYKGNGDEEGYFGMSDNVGPVTLKQGVRVPPVVANIAELRRSLMGHGREEKEDDHRSTSQNQHRQKSHQHSSDEPRSAEERLKNINLRPRPQQKYRSPILVEDKSKNEMVSDPAYDKHETASISEKDELFSLPSERRRERRDKRRSNNSTKLNNNEFPMNNHLTSSSDVEEFVEEKWPTPSESEIRRYSQGNATIEKTSDNSLTSIRFGSRTNEQGRRLREQWIDVHQRQVISNVGPRQDVAMSSFSLNIDGGELDDKHCATTPALAKRPVPPLLRYLSAKQTIKKKW